MTKIKENKAITLIALIITIIIILILTGIAINITLGNNGLIPKAIEATDAIKIAEIKEKIRMELLDKQIDNEGRFNKSEVEDILSKYGEIIYDTDNTTIKELDVEGIQQNIDVTDILNETIIGNDIYVNKSVLYCWDYEQSLQSYRDNFYGMCDELNISSVYFCFDPTNFTTHKEETKKFISDLNNKGISILGLSGDVTWSYSNTNAKSTFIDPIVSYNNEARDNEKIVGVVIDTEPAGTAEWQTNQSNALRSYVDTQIELYNYVTGKNLLCIQCIASWFDEVNTEALEDLVRSGCDGISVMNYWKNSMIENIRTEVGYAKKYNKKIDSISGFGEPDAGNGGDNITFYNDGMDVAKTKYKEVEDEYKYNKLGMAYHDYNSLNKILGKQYTIEVYVNKGSQKLANTRIKVINIHRETVDIHEATTTSDGYAVFWLEYGKNYRVEIEGYGVAGTTSDFSKKQFSYLIKDGSYFAIDVYAYEEVPVTTYTAEIYFKYQNNSTPLTNAQVTIRNVNDANDTYVGTTHSQDGYIACTLRHGATYEVQVNGYNSIVPSTFSYNSDIGNYKAFDIICN